MLVDTLSGAGPATAAPALQSTIGAASPPSPLEWRALEGLGVVDGIRDLALDGASGFALADARGVVAGRLEGAAAGPAAPWTVQARRVAAFGLCTRVRFDGRGGWFAVGERGLIHVDATGRTRDATPRAGQGGRALIALDRLGRWLVVGGEGGVWVSRLSDSAAGEVQGLGPWRQVGQGLAAGLVTDVALGPVVGPDRVALWIVAGGELHLAWLGLDADGVRASPSRVQRPAGRPIGDPVRRVRFDAGPGTVVALYTRAAARVVGAPLRGDAEQAPRWEVVFPRLPPSAELIDVGFSGRETWWASSSGVLRGSLASGGVERSSPPLGHRASAALAVDGAQVWSATTRGLWVGAPRVMPAARFGAVERMPRDPELAAVHARALLYLRLGTEPTARLWRGLGRRAWLPSVHLHGGADYGSDRDRDYDENFSYGQLNRLNDRSSGRSAGFDAGIALSWDLADLAYSPEAVDLSREARQVIGLRDTVLDELNQLYFDRQRTLRALAAFGDWSDPEAAALRLRALELAAGLDGWTGGWFSAHVELPAGARASWSPQPVEPHPMPASAPIRAPADPARADRPHAPVPILSRSNDS